MLLNLKLYSNLLNDYSIDWMQWNKDIKQYISLMKEWNKNISLVSQRDIENDCVTHIEDSLSLIPYIFDKINDSQKKIWLDIGPGGGFPSIPVLIARKETPAILIERKTKKAGFLQMLASKFKLANTKVVCDSFPQYFQSIGIKKEQIHILTARGIEKPDPFAHILQKWLGKGTRYLCQSPHIHELFNDSSFKKDFIYDTFDIQNLRRGRLVIIERR